MEKKSAKIQKHCADAKMCRCEDVETCLPAGKWEDLQMKKLILTLFRGYYDFSEYSFNSH
jgi:hypothetical protein